MVRNLPAPAPVRALRQGWLVLLAAFVSSAVAGEETAVPVSVIRAEEVRGFVQDLTLTGTVTSPRRARLSSRTEGLVEELAVDAGSAVRKGDVLMTLDTRLAGITLELVEAEIAQAEVEVAEAKRRADEVEELAKTGGFARSEAESRIAEVRIAEANLKRLQVKREEQAEVIERHRLVAPFDGVISRKVAEAGEWVTTGTPVVELVEIERLRFDLQVPQEYLARVRGAESVVVTLDAYPGEGIPAEIDVLVPVKDAVSRTFLTRLSLADSDGRAAPGMSGTATITSRPRPGKSVRIPRDAVVRYPDGSAKVWVVEKEGGTSKVTSRTVRTAGALGAMAEVIEGLRGGEEIVLEGNETLREEQAVEILPGEKPDPAG